MSAAAAFQKANNQSGFDFAMNAAFYERAWIDPTMLAIEGSYPTVAGSYKDAVNLARQGLDGCARGTAGPADLACQDWSAGRACNGSTAQSCESDVQSAATRIQTFLVALLQNPAPNARANLYSQLQADLAKADTALLAITDGLLIGDSAKATSGRSTYAVAIVDADGDGSALGIG